MSDEKEKKVSRREFLRTAGITGLSSLLAISPFVSGRVFADETPKASPTPTPAPQPKIALRDFGKTGVKVPILSLGGIIDFTTNQILLKKALDLGVTYWDTANSYNGGNSEDGIGKFFEKFPEARKSIFLVTKGGARDAAGLDKMLATSISRMKTDYIDLYFIHGISKIEEMSPEIKAWAEKVKKEGKIRFMGFSTHKNMAELLAAAPALGWIDGIMTTYNYRLMHEDGMKKAVEACHKAGIGLTAMKTQGGGPVKTDSDKELELAGRFLQKGFTPEQAKIKAVWSNEAIAAICSQMTNLALLSANFAAAVDKTKLETSDLMQLKAYADATCSGYCMGCENICGRTLDGKVPVADVMRYMMYHRSYGDTALARMHFAELPRDIRGMLSRLDYSAAERVCPQHLAIGEIMKEAVRVLG